MEDWDSDEKGLARNSDPETSHEAAELVNVSGLMQEIYYAMADFGMRGCISDEVGDALPHLEVQMFTPRFKQMVNRGMIVNTGEKRRGSHNGRMQMVRRVLEPPFTKPRKITVERCFACGHEIKSESPPHFELSN